MPNRIRVIVIGAGPAGLMAAITAAAAGATVTVMEQLPRPGLKLLSTGGGRCNLTNTATTAALTAAFGRQGRFMLPALENFSRDDLLAFFRHRGVPVTATDGFHFFPASGSAADIRQALLAECRHVGVTILTDAPVDGLVMAAKHITGVRCHDRALPAERVIIACGGKGYPALGGCGRGYDLARQAGHEIIPPVPAMVGLQTRESWPGTCAGIALPDGEVKIDLPRYRGRKERGELLFTHHGLSGPPIINLSGEVSALLQKHPAVPLSFNWQADRDRTGWQLEMNSWQQHDGKKMVQTLLAAILPQTLARQFCREAGIAAATRTAELPASGRERLIELLTASRLEVVATAGWDKAMVTRGGVALKNIDPATLSSRLVAGLYFAGEVLDLDGPCGGYNLQWAFSSGHLAGHAAGSNRSG
ncbi:MAG: aminoacetone oxidase family FAD-binding enzyme [Victivallales bacterium]|nr:aminoacetone oxidase family FAD-binding enzyme [Victivallales bacterium]